MAAPAEGARKVLEYSVKCPNCGKEAVGEDYIYDSPLAGRLLLTTLKCPHCGYTFKDVMSLEFGSPVEIVYRVERPGDERPIVVKSASAIVRIPELQIEVHPSLASRGIITTIEGIILDILEKVEMACSWERVGRCDELIEALKKAASGLRPLTIVIEDPLGGSRVLSEKAIVRPAKASGGELPQDERH